MPKQKIDHKKITDALIKEVEAIEASDQPQQAKTQKFKAAAARFINALYKDGRKFSGAKGEKRRIGLDTAQRYLRYPREVFEEKGWKHHLLARDLERFKKRYPNHASVIAELEGLPVKETRLRHKSLCEQMDNARYLLSSVEEIDFSKASAPSKVKRLAQANSLYEEQLMALLGKDPQKAMEVLDKTLREREKLAGDLAGLKVNHEIMYHLRLPTEDANSLKRKRSRSLAKKKNMTIAIDYERYISRVANILSNPEMSSNSGGSSAIAPLTFAICAVTGRRPIEVLIQGRFDAIDEHKIAFSGQAKKRFEEETHADRWFYSLVDSAIVIRAVKYLRSMQKVQEMAAAVPEDGDYRTANQIVNNRTASVLNTYAKDFFADQARTIKDTRGTWVRAAYNMWFDVDPYWAEKDEDIFFTEMLGQTDPKVQMFYKSFKVRGADINYDPKPIVQGNRLEKLKALDDQMPALARGDSAVKLHTAVKALIEENPTIKITQSMLISPPISAFRDMVKRYLELCADALGIEKVGNRWKPKQEAESQLPPVLVEVEADDQEQPEEPAQPDQAEPEEPATDNQEHAEAEPEPEPEPESKPAAKPERKAKPRMDSEKLPDGQWRGSITVDGAVVATAQADTGAAAMKKAWRRYEDDNAKIYTTIPMKGRGKVKVEIKLFDKVVVKLEEYGDGEEVEAAAWETFQRRS